MFTNAQLDFLVWLSVMTSFGVLAGAFLGILIGTTVRSLRFTITGDSLVGAAFAVVPAAASSAITAIVLSTIEAILFGPSSKGSYDAPTWFVLMKFCAVLLAGGLVVPLAIPLHPRRPRRALLWRAFWAATGALLGAIASLWVGVGEYYRVGSDGPLLRFGIMGAVLGGIVVVMWRLLIESLLRRESKRGRS